MALETRLAWRNVWRNPRRTGLTMAATVFAVFLVVIFVGMAAGVHEKMIEDSVRVHSGHVTVAARGYLEERTLDDYVRLRPPLVALLDRTPGIVAWTPRVVSFALLSKTESSQGAVILGVDPEREGRVTTLPQRVRQGRFLEPGGHHEIVLGERLARSLEAELGDEILLYGSAYSLETAYDLYRVVGVMKLPEPGLDRSLAAIGLADAQELFVYGDRVSEIAILAAGADRSGALRDRLAAGIAALPGGAGGGSDGEGSGAAAAVGAGPAADPPVAVYTWNQVMPELEQLIFLDDAGMYIMLAILVLVVGFGILNTILMAVLERMREFGVMLAVGLRPRSLFRMIYLESMLLAAVGLGLGLAVAVPTLAWFQAHPIEIGGASLQGVYELFGVEPVITFKLKPLNPLGSSVAILAVGALAALYPAAKASRARPADVLRSL